MNSRATQRHGRTRTNTDHQTRNTRYAVRLLVLSLATCNLQPATAATVTGTLQDVSIQGLETKLMFAPTNDVLVNNGGLSAGPPKVIDTVNGAFSIVLDAGDYTVSLPLISWRKPFVISVFATNGAVNITNLLAAPKTYTYTNNLNFTVKATPDDAGPDVLGAKLDAGESLAKTTNLVGSVASIVLGVPTNTQLRTLSVSADGPLAYYDWAVLSNGVVAVPAFNSGHGQPRAPGLYFFNTNGAEMGSILSWADHGGAANLPELLIQSRRNLAIIPGQDGQYVNGFNGEVQLGLSGAFHDEFHVQYDDDYTSSTWADGLGSFVAPNNLGHSKRLEFRAHDTLGNTAEPGIVGFSGGDSALAGGYGLLRGGLRFYSVAPQWAGLSSGFSATPGIMVGEMMTNGWNLRGSLVQQSAVAASGAGYAVDFRQAFAQVVDVTAAAVTFTTANLAAGATNFQSAHLLIRSGPYSPTLTFPSWRWGNEAGSATAPASLAAEKLLDVSLHALGPDDTNVLASYTIHAWPFAYDIDAQDFFTRASITDTTQKLAVHQLVLDAKAHSWWTRCDAIYPFVGGTASKHSHNLKSSSYQLTWHGTLTHDANGVTGDGSTGYGDTGFSPRTAGSQFTTNSAHLFVYSGTTSPVDNNSLIGAFSDTGGGSYRAYVRRNGALLSATGFNNDLGAASAGASGDFRGPVLGSRTDSSHMFAALRGATSANDSTAAARTPDSNIYVVGVSADGALGNATDANLRGATIGAGLSASDWTQFRADWDKFEETLGRKVP